MDCSTLGFPVLHCLPEFAQTHVHWAGDAIQPSHSLSPLLLLPSIFPSITVFSMSGLFSSSSQSIGTSAWALVLPVNIQGWFPLGLFYFLAAQETLKSLLQHHSSKASILQCSAFLMVQISYLYMTTGKTIALTIWAFVGKVMSLLFNTLSRFVRAFLLRRKYLLISISRLQLLSAVIFGAQENKVCLLFPLFSLLFAMKWLD